MNTNETKKDNNGCFNINTNNKIIKGVPANANKTNIFCIIAAIAIPIIPKPIKSVTITEE